MFNPINLLPAFYSFEIWDSDSTGILAGALFGLLSPKAQVTLRLPPQSLTIEQSYRMDLGLDLAGNPVVAEAGFGPGRWSLRGVHGVGPSGMGTGSMVAGPLSAGRASDGIGLIITRGLQKRTDLQNLFLAYADGNKERLAAGLRPYKLVFGIRGGPPSEFQNEEWWIMPMGMPTDERTAGRPHDWAFSVSFWALDRVSSVYTRPITIRSIKGLLADIQDAIAAVKRLTKVLDISRWPIVQSIRAGLLVVQQAAYAVQSLRTTVLKDVKTACGLLDQASTAISVVRNALNLSTLRADIKSEIHSSMNQLRVSLGLVDLHLRTNATSQAARPVTPAKMPVVPGKDLRRMAAAAYGDESKWTLIADANGLVFPWVAWPDAGGNLPASTLTPGIVRTPGSAVQPPSLAAQAVLVDDPVGTDIDPAGVVDANGHLGLVGGITNLKGALLRRLQTPRGYLPQHPDYGSLLASFLGCPFDVPTALAIRADVSRTLRQDPRVQSVSAVSVAPSAAGGVVVSATVQTVLGSFAISTPALIS